MGLNEIRSAVVAAMYIVASWTIVPVAAADTALGTVDIQSPPIVPEAAKTLKDPVPFNNESIARGRATFLATCTGCHGRDGKAQAAEVANATDLTSPPLWKHGTSEGEIFRSIRDGAGLAMPAFKAQIHQERDLWDLVNFIRGLWPASMRPAAE